LSVTPYGRPSGILIELETHGCTVLPVAVPAVRRLGMVEPAAVPPSSPTLYGVVFVQAIATVVCWLSAVASTPFVPKFNGVAEIAQLACSASVTLNVAVAVPFA